MSTSITSTDVMARLAAVCSEGATVTIKPVEMRNGATWTAVQIGAETGRQVAPFADEDPIEAIVGALWWHESRR